MPAPSLPSASLAENLRFNEAVIVPNALQGLFKRRPRAVGAATKINVDSHAVSLLGGLKRRHGGRPVWVRVVKDRALLLLDVDDVRRALEGSPHPFASDPEAKRKGMAHFQPDALTISRGELWELRRKFTEDVLGTAERTLTAHFTAVVEEELSRLDGGRLDHDLLHPAFRRITRRVVLGEAAADDEQLSEVLGELMSQANKLPTGRSGHLDDYSSRVREYFSSAPEDSLAGLAARTEPAPDVRADGQLTHWMFATQDTLALNVVRALALTAALGDAARDARSTLLEAMRLWPTTPLLSREILGDLVWHGVRVPAGTNVLISNTFMHRDRDRLGEAADRFTPEGWAKGGVFEDDWGVNFFSHGPQGCPGATLALDLGAAAINALAGRGELHLLRPDLEASKPLPHMLDPFAIRLTAG